MAEYVTSADGTRIAYERSGSGPPLVLVHGSLNDRNIWAFVLPAFQQHYTAFAMDRRGRGESSPSGEHALERQFEDVVAVINAAGEPVDLIGHSYGAQCALGAAALARGKVKRLVLYEPPGVEMARRELARTAEIADASEAVEQFMVGGVGIAREQIAVLKATPYWDYVVGLWPTMEFEGPALMNHEFDASRFASLTMPALFLVGSDSQDRLGIVLREIFPFMPHAERVTFEGQGHGAVMLAPKLFADKVLEFLSR